MAKKEESLDSFGSFAETMAVFGKLNGLESKVSAAIEVSKVPPKEIRKMLRGQSLDGIQNTPVFQFLRQLFSQLGFGTIELTGRQDFGYMISIPDSPVCDIFSSMKGKKTCHITTDTIKRIFQEDLGLPGIVSEVLCRNAGSDKCVFEVDLQPLAVYKIALDDIDFQITEKIIKGEFNIEKMSGELGCGMEAIEYRLSVLKRFHIVSEDLEPTEIGKTYYSYGDSLVGKTEDFEPPWKEMSQISHKISDSQSFAQAIKETTGEKTEVVEVDNSTVVNIAGEAKKSKGFAELLSKHYKKVSEDE